MFTTPCFIKKHSKKLEDKLLEFGYNEFIFNSKEFIAVNQTNFPFGWFTVDDMNGVNCGRNEKLFLSIAALRDDTDLNQYFVLDTNISNIETPESIIPKKTFVKCLTDKWYGPKDIYDSCGFPAHKATVEELIEHFKLKKL